MEPTQQLDQPVEVLLAEDSKTQARLMKSILDREPRLNLLAIVEDGVEAMNYLRREGRYENAKQPGLVLLDIDMPRMNGFEVLNEMKADPQLRKIPVIMLTSSTDDHDVVKSYEDGANTYIAKPLQPKDLSSIFRRFTDYWIDAAKLPPKT
jgi:CheY-like chemotaxis protein